MAEHKTNARIDFMSLKDSVTSQNAETREELNGKIAELQIELSRNRQEMDKKLQLIFD